MRIEMLGFPSLVFGLAFFCSETDTLVGTFVANLHRRICWIQGLLSADAQLGIPSLCSASVAPGGLAPLFMFNVL